MIDYTNTFSSFSVDDLGAAKTFYGKTLGLHVKEEGQMGLSMKLEGGTSVFIYPKDNHQPSTYTVLNFEVDDIDKAIDSLTEGGVQFIHYDDDNLPQDEKGVLRGKHAGMGPDIAWFEDPAGNILSLIEKAAE